MPKQYTSRQIAAHFSQSYIDQNGDDQILSDFIKTLEGRVPKLRRQENRQQYQDVSSLLYCMKDLKGACRDAGNCAQNGARKDCSRNISRAANRLQEIGQLLTEIHHNYPEEYEKSCKGFISKWRGLEFDKGEKFLEETGAMERRSPGFGKTEELNAEDRGQTEANKPAEPAAAGLS